MFWGNEILEVRLRDLITEYDESRLDRATYRLRIGPEIYVSPTGEPGDQKNKPKTLLSPGAAFTIPAGQLALLLTQESIKIPSDALALISMRAKYKYRGLVNVSGFHVDPGYDGRLVFAVFNAGPGPVHLYQGEECFHIWYAALEGPSVLPPKKGPQSIPSEMITWLSGEIQSFAGLNSKINDNEKRLSDRIVALEREHAVIKWAAALIVGGVLTLGLRECSGGQRPAAGISPPAASSHLNQPPPKTKN